MHQSIADALKTVVRGETLSEEAARDVMHALMAGAVTPVQTAGLLTAIAVRGESVEEIVGFAKAMREYSMRIEPPVPVVDTCGTGGDGSNTFNISTAAAIVCAAAGVPVAKHGNTAVSSRSGSADVLAALGARIHLSPSEALDCLVDTNLCFLFAQQYHPAMKHVAEARRQLGFRTVFNVLGPLTNPAGARRQVIGVFRRDLVDTVAHALARLGTEHALVVHGTGGIDEFSLAGENYVAEVKAGTVRTFCVEPGDIGLATAPVSEIAGGDAAENARIIRDVLQGTRGAARDVVLLNAAAVLYVSGRAGSIRQGAAAAATVIESGRAYETLGRFIERTHQIRCTEVAQ